MERGLRDLGAPGFTSPTDERTLLEALWKLGDWFQKGFNDKPGLMFRILGILS